MNFPKKGVLVTRLDSIEDAAFIDIFCFDKTGTITQNILSVVDSTAVGKFNKEEVIKMAVLASQQDGMDAIDLSIINYSKSITIDLGGYEKISYAPFNPENKKTEAIVKFKGKSIRIVKGAAQTIMGLFGEIDKTILEQSNNAINGFAEKGSRTIGVAISEVESTKQLSLVGFLAITDPPRENSKRWK